MQKTTPKNAYDTAMRGRAYTGLALRLVVAGYLVYLAYNIMTSMQEGSSTIPGWAVWVICIAFGAVAIGFCAYAWMFFRKALKAAELAPVPAPGVGDSGIPGEAPDDTDDAAGQE